MNIVQRARNILITPKKEWLVIAAENLPAGRVIGAYVVPFLAADAIAAFIGYGFIGFSYGPIRIAGVDWGIYQALAVFIGGLISVFLTAAVVDMLAPTFHSEKNFQRSLQLVAFSFTPAWAGGLLAIIPVVAVLGSLFGLYGLYLMYVGLPLMKKTPEDKVAIYFIIILVVTIIIYLIVGGIIAGLRSPMLGPNYAI